MKKLFTLLCLAGATGAMAQSQDSPKASGLFTGRHTQSTSSLTRLPALQAITANKTLGMKHTLDSIISQSDYEPWENTYSEVYRYDGTGAFDNGILGYWDDSALLWDFTDSIKVTNPTLPLPNFINYTQNQNTNNWEEYWKTVFIYDGNGNLTQRIDSMYNAITNLYEADFKVEYVYNSSNKLTQISQYNWMGSWVGSTRADYTYNSNGDPILVKGKTWDYNSNTFYTTDSATITYTGTTAATRLLSYRNSSSNTWHTALKTDYTFDSNGNPVFEENWNWDSNSNQWLEDRRSYFTYDLTTSYADVVAPVKEVYQPYFLNKIVNKPLTIKTEEYLSFVSQWMNDDSTTYYYSQKDLAVNDKITKLTTAIYPNPATDVVSIELASSQPATISIYNAAGQVVLAQQLRGKASVAIGTLTKGLYLYTITQGAATETGKLVLE